MSERDLFLMYRLELGVIDFKSVLFCATICDVTGLARQQRIA